MIPMTILIAALGACVGAFVGAILTEWAPRKGAWQIAAGAATLATIGCYFLAIKTQTDPGVPSSVLWAGALVGLVGKLIHYRRNRPQAQEPQAETSA